MINIPSYISDPNYRYTMPKMILKAQSKGNGKKTNITNLVDVAIKLRTNPQYILKFIGIELGSQTTYIEVSKNNITTIVQGAFNYETLIKVLDKFIDKYVCCPKCKYPETSLYVKKNKVMATCDACGFDGDLDSTHDICALILKKPPKQNKIIKKPANELAEFVDNGLQVQAKNKKVKLTKDDLPLDGQKIKLIIAKLQQDYKTIIASQQDPQIITAHLSAQIKAIGIQKTLTDRFGYIIFNIIFDEKISKQIKTGNHLYKLLIKKFTGQNRSLETIMNLMFLYTTTAARQILQFAPTILKFMMEHQIIEEEFLTLWAEQKPIVMKQVEEHFLYTPERHKQFRQIVSKFIEWLVQEESQEEG